MRDSLYVARLLAKPGLGARRRNGETKRQYDGAVATFSPSPGGSIRENFCKRRAGEREGESRLALITFAYPTYITAGHGCTRAEKVVKMVRNNFYMDSTTDPQIQQTLYFITPELNTGSALISFPPSLFSTPTPLTRLASFAASLPPPLYL